MSNLVLAAAAAGVAFLIYEFSKKDDEKDPKDDTTHNNSSTQSNGSTNPPQTPPAPAIELPNIAGAIRCTSGVNTGLYFVPRAPYPAGIIDSGGNTSGPSLLSDQDYRSAGVPDEIVTYPNQEKKFYWRQGAKDCNGL